MRRKPENRRNMANSQNSRNRQSQIAASVNSDDFDEFIEQMLTSDNSAEDSIYDRPICHVY